jgi:uncharacterized membrane protein
MLSRAGNLEYDRVLFFSDAVFAIAITLLVVGLRVPDLPARLIDAGQQLRAVEPRIFAFFLSFAVIGLFWTGHHSIFRYITALDRVLILINLLFLGTIAFLPYPTALLGATGTSQAPATILYAACVGAVGLGELAIWLWAIRADLVPTPFRRSCGAISPPACWALRWCSRCRSRWRWSRRVSLLTYGWHSYPSAWHCATSCSRRSRSGRRPLSRRPDRRVAQRTVVDPVPLLLSKPLRLRRLQAGLFCPTPTFDGHGRAKDQPAGRRTGR